MEKFEIIRTESGVTCPVYCSMPAETLDEKKALYNIVQNTTTRLFDMMNQTINMKHVYCKGVDNTGENGEVKNAIRTIIIDENGNSYHATSSGITSSLAEIFAIFGTPDMWENPIPVKVKSRTCAKGQTMILEMV